MLEEGLLLVVSGCAVVEILVGPVVAGMVGSAVVGVIMLDWLVVTGLLEADVVSLAVRAVVEDFMLLGAVVFGILGTFFSSSAPVSEIISMGDS